MRRSFLFFILLIPYLLQAQDVTGVWQGHFRSGTSAMRSSLFDDRYKFEVQIAQNNKSFEAVTYSYLSTIFYGKAAAAGTVNGHTGKVLLQEGKLLEVRNQSGDVCIMTCFLQYSKSGDEEFLEGTYVSMNTRDSSNCGRGTVFLRKVASSDFYKEPFLVKRERELGKEKLAPIKAAPPKAGTAKTPPVKPSTAKTTPPPAKPATAKTGNTPANPSTAKTTAPGTKPGANPTVRTDKPAAPRPAAKPVRPSGTGPTAKSPPPMAMAKIGSPKETLKSPSGDSSTGMGRHFPTITPRILQTRSNPVVKTITVHVNEVTLNIYDDGAIDHDTISVYLDNRQVISHAMLTDRPLVLTLHLDDTNDYHELVMVAENEGEIPPNTSLMIVKAGDKEYEVRITSTEQKNAMVTFKYVK
jgi:hypothetical protein